MSYVNGMMPGPELDEKPWGNSNSLVPEIRGRGVNGMSPKATSHGKAPDVVHSTSNRNNAFTDLKGTGKS